MSAQERESDAARVSDRILLLDVFVLLSMLIAATVGASAHDTMVAIMIGLVALRFGLFIALRRPGSRELAGEAALYLVCLLAGSLNDWNTVDRHGVYSYLTPHAWPAIATIPVWMAPFWGQILRLMYGAATWVRWRPTAPRPMSSLRISVLGVVLVVITRQSIYHFYQDPIWSWLPYAAALVVYAVVTRPDRGARRLALAVLLAGPPAEMLLIGAAHLHHYHLGWFAGVPLWIILWWLMAAWFLRDLHLAWLEWRAHPMATHR